MLTVTLTYTSRDGHGTTDRVRYAKTLDEARAIIARAEANGKRFIEGRIDDPALVPTLRAGGFEFTTTGGPCTAFRAQPSDECYLLITRDDDPSAPGTLGEPVTLGTYWTTPDGDALDDGTLVNFPSVTAALDSLQ